MSVDREAIRTRLNAATRGPWQALRSIANNIQIGDPDRMFFLADLSGESIHGTFTREPQRIADAEFIAHAPTDIAALLAALEEAEAEIERQHLYRGALRVDLTEAEAERDAYKQRYEEWESTDEECPHRVRLDTAEGHIRRLDNEFGDRQDAWVAARAFLADGPNTEETDATP